MFDIVDAIVWESQNGQAWRPISPNGGVLAQRTTLYGVTTIGNSFLAFGQEVTSGTGSDDDPIRSTSVFWQSRSS